MAAAVQCVSGVGLLEQLCRDMLLHALCFAQCRPGSPPFILGLKCKGICCVPGIDEEATCCVKFNDLFLNYTITPDLSQCALGTPVEQPVLETSFVVALQIDNLSNFESESNDVHRDLIAATYGNATANVSIAA